MKWYVSILGDADYLVVSTEKDRIIKLKNEPTKSFTLPNKYAYKWTHDPSKLEKFDCYLILKNGNRKYLVPRKIE